MAAWQSILGALWLFLPAFVANMSPVITAKLVPGWRTPIDFGALHKDGGRVLGDGKTWRGVILGAILAGGTAVGLATGQPSFVPDGHDMGRAAGATWWGIFLFGAAMGGTALVGDAVESFFKRRRGKERGAPWFPFDQLDFVVFGLAAAFVYFPLLGSDWALDAYGDPWVIGTLVIGTPALHVIVNRIGYWLKLKEVPW